MSDVAAPSTPKPKAGALLLRLGVAHLLAYPIAFAWAVAWIPPLIVSLPESFLVSASTDEVVHVVLRRLGWPSAAVFVVEHLAVLPWALGGGPRRKRAFVVSTVAIAALAVLGGGAFWLWLVLR